MARTKAGAVASGTLLRFRQFIGIGTIPRDSSLSFMVKHRPSDPVDVDDGPQVPHSLSFMVKHRPSDGIGGHLVTYVDSRSMALWEGGLDRIPCP